MLSRLSTSGLVRTLNSTGFGCFLCICVCDASQLRWSRGTITSFWVLWIRLYELHCVISRHHAWIIRHSLVSRLQLSGGAAPCCVPKMQPVGVDGGAQSWHAAGPFQNTHASSRVPGLESPLTHFLFHLCFQFSLCHLLLCVYLVHICVLDLCFHHSWCPFTDAV